MAVLGIAGPGVGIICLTCLLKKRILQLLVVEIVVLQGCVLHLLIRLNLHEATCSECCSFVINHCGSRRGKHGNRYVYVSFS